MNSMKMWVSAALGTLCCAFVTAHFAWSQTTGSGARSQTKDRAKIVLSQPLSKLDGDHLKVVLVEVHYGPGEASLPHSHPCAVVGYVVEGALRSQVKGRPEMIYKAGESFYEPPNGVHLVSANASSTKLAKFVAYLICDHDMPLSVDAPENIQVKGGSR